MAVTAGPWIARARQGAVTTGLGFLLSLLEAGAYIARMGRRLSLLGRGATEAIIAGAGWGVIIEGVWCRILLLLRGRAFTVVSLLVYWNYHGII